MYSDEEKELAVNLIKRRRQPKPLNPLAAVAIFLCAGVASFWAHENLPSSVFAGMTRALLGVAAIPTTIDFVGVFYRRYKIKTPIFSYLGLGRTIVIGLASYLAAFIVSGAILGVAVIVRWCYLGLKGGSLPGTQTGIGVAIAVLFFGFLLFMFRLRFRVCYGLTEIFAGMLVAFLQVQPLSTGAATFNLALGITLLTAGVYLVVRGLDNFHVGINSPKPDALWALMSRLGRWKDSKR